MFWVGCDHNYVGAMLAMTGWSCEPMLEADELSQVGRLGVFRGLLAKSASLAIGVGGSV